jgi:cytochrome c oxidase subunit II
LRRRDVTAPLGVLGSGAVLLTLAACGAGEQSILRPAGPAADRVAVLWWLMFWISLAVFLVVVGLLVAALLRARRPGDPDAPAPWGEPFIVITGVVASGIILVFVFLFSVRQMQVSAEWAETDLTIEVTAHNWWWEVRYPGGVVTANEIHIPTGEPVRFVLEAADLIHSFWVPELGPKTDMIPGRTNELVLQADEPGRYRGACAEYCGLQHANMALWVFADEPEGFQGWLANEAEPAAPPDTELAQRGHDVFMSTTCIGCHAIRGTEARSRFGPDLTHLAGRTTLASGILPNDEATLSSWIGDPQSMKPGAQMPPTSLTPSELRALVAYLAGLE